MKTIVVKWVKEEGWGYGKAMRVIESDHERYSKGTRFDFGFFNIATDEGYTIVSLPLEDERPGQGQKKVWGGGKSNVPLVQLRRVRQVTARPT